MTKGNVAKYYNHDHLGNTRISYNVSDADENNNTLEIQYNLDGVYEYYPYGKVLRSFVPIVEDRYLYTGKERDQETGYDFFGARYYDNEIGRWLSLDPLASKYPGLSPYNYVAGNPVKFIDPDGREIVDANGKAITYNAKTGWSSNATADVLKIGNALLMTNDGANALQAYMDSPTKVSLVLSQDVCDDCYGETIGRGRYKDETGAIHYKKATVTIYQGSIDEEGSRFGSTKEGINATGVHERWHLDPEQIVKDKNEPNSFPTETLPLNKEYDTREQYNDKYNNGSDDWKKIYETPNPNVTDDYGNPKPSITGTRND